ncbi:MAG: hypothetical protein K8S54_16530 [Spirochaetia bacterium]|nr:hypothetical protein [Spirochaetia bacterium]
MPGIIQAYKTLAKNLGPSNWWPGETPFEVMVGAILTQNTSWKNVERAIEQLRIRDLLVPEKLHSLTAEELAPIIRSSGYFNQKSRKLKNLVNWFRTYNYSVTDVISDHRSTLEIRSALLDLNGVGPETADSILCYAFALPLFVVDTYTVRWLSRYNPQLATNDYHELQSLVTHAFQRAYKSDNPAGLTGHYNEFHALIVRLGYATCTKSNPDCGACPLRRQCNYGKQSQAASRSAIKRKSLSRAP